jgi:hypothetical protein
MLGKETVKDYFRGGQFLAGAYTGGMIDLRPLLKVPIRELQVEMGFKSYSSFWCIITGRKRASAELAVKLSASTGIPKSTIRPDLWPPRKTRQTSEEPQIQAAVYGG